jgi:hypothetical protein
MQDAGSITEPGTPSAFSYFPSTYSYCYSCVAIMSPNFQPSPARPMSLRLANSLVLSSFFHTHTKSATMLLVAFLAAFGYLETRVFRDEPMMARTTWFTGLLILCLALSGLPVSGWFGVLFVATWMVLGVAGMVRFFSRRATSDEPEAHETRR